LLWSLNKKFNLTHPDLISRIREILENGFINVLARQAAYVSEDEWKRAYLDIQTQQQRWQKQDKSFFLFLLMKLHILGRSGARSRSASS
jgi:hypothetical protein